MKPATAAACFVSAVPSSWVIAVSGTTMVACAVTASTPSSSNSSSTVSPAKMVLALAVLIALAA
jgi:hypothetical protein